jgi:hypothetical protein
MELSKVQAKTQVPAEGHRSPSYDYNLEVTMKVMKSLLLGSAAGVVALSGAQAADLPVKAKAVEYVKVCSAYGAGFYYIPGTDICLRVGGLLRVDYNIHGPAGRGQSWFQGTSAVPINDADSATGWRSRGALILDARTNTAYGTLRSYALLHISNESSATATANANAPSMDAAFIQFAGFTFGYAPSLWKFAGAYGMNALIGSGDLVGISQVAYTAQLGNGVSASIAIEDANPRRGYLASSTIFTQTGTLITPLTLNASYKGQYYPDLTANVRVDQAWGSAIITGALREVHAAASTVSVGPEKWGYAVGAGIEVKLDAIAPKDRAQIFASYGKGATGYAGSGPGGNFGVTAITNNTGLAGPVALWVDATEAAASAGSLSLTKHTAVVGQFQHYWTPMLRTNIGAGYTKLDLDNRLTVANSFHPDARILNATVATIWSPVANLDLGVEVMWYDVKTTANWIAPINQFSSSADGWSGTLRAQRNF